MKLVYFGEKTYLPESTVLPSEEPNSKLKLVSTKSLLKGKADFTLDNVYAPDDPDDEVLNLILSKIYFRWLQCGRDFAYLKDTRDRYYAFGDCSKGQILAANRKWTSIKKLKKIRFKYKKERTPMQQVIVGAENCISIDYQQRIYGWGCSGSGQLGGNFDLILS